MKQLILKLLKWFLIITSVALIIALVFGGVLLMHWPWWTGCFILTGILGICLVIVLVRKLLLRRREQNFVHQVIEQDESYLRSLDKKDKTEVTGTAGSLEGGHGGPATFQPQETRQSLICTALVYDRR